MLRRELIGWANGVICIDDILRFENLALLKSVLRQSRNIYSPCHIQCGGVPRSGDADAAEVLISIRWRACTSGLHTFERRFASQEMPATVDGSLRSPLNIKLLGEVRRTRMETDGTDAVDSKFACSKKTVSIGSRRQKDQLTESVSVADYKLVGCRGDMLVNDLKFSD
jgi:hypothetical protein